ncbi:MAG: FxsA family protein [Pseudomonadota bacterium]|nr:FxsA family protein [Pseudomonadota bacterium]
MFSFQKILPIFIIVPIIELVVLIGLADWVGFFPTLILIISTAFIGVNMLKRQGVNTLNKIRAAARSNKVPTNEVIQGVMLFFAGGLLLTPGLVTDVVGFSILIPQSRRWIASKLEKYAQPIFVGEFSTYSYEQADQSYQDAQKQRNKSSDSVVIDGEFTDESKL